MKVTIFLYIYFSYPRLVPVLIQFLYFFSDSFLHLDLFIWLIIYLFIFCEVLHSFLKIQPSFSSCFLPFCSFSSAQITQPLLLSSLLWCRCERCLAFFWHYCLSTRSAAVATCTQDKLTSCGLEGPWVADALLFLLLVVDTKTESQAYPLQS